MRLLTWRRKRITHYYLDMVTHRHPGTITRLHSTSHKKTQIERVSISKSITLRIDIGRAARYSGSTMSGPHFSLYWAWLSAGYTKPPYFRSFLIAQATILFAPGNSTPSLIHGVNPKCMNSTPSELIRP